MDYSTNSNKKIPENFVWNALLLVETTTTSLPTKFSNEFDSLIEKLDAGFLEYEP
jgi:hypothetical protein